MGRRSAMRLTLLFWTLLVTSHSFVASNSSPGGEGKKPSSSGGKDVSGSGSSGEGSGLDEGGSSGEGSGLDGSESGNKKTLRQFKEPVGNRGLWHKPGWWRGGNDGNDGNGGNGNRWLWHKPRWWRGGNGANGNRWLWHKPQWWRGGSGKNDGPTEKPPAPPKYPMPPAPPKQSEPKVNWKWKLPLANGTIIKGNGALPEIWVQNESAEDGRGRAGNSTTNMQLNAIQANTNANSNTSIHTLKGATVTVNSRAPEAPSIDSEEGVVGRTGVKYITTNANTNKNTGSSVNVNNRAPEVPSDDNGDGRSFGYGRWGYVPYYRSGGEPTAPEGQGKIQGDGGRAGKRNGGATIINTNENTNTNTGATVNINSTAPEAPSSAA